MGIRVRLDRYRGEGSFIQGRMKIFNINSSYPFILFPQLGNFRKGQLLLPGANFPFEQSLWAADIPQRTIA